MLTSDESEQIFTELEKILAKQEMSWVADQVNEQIRLGKPVQREIEEKEGIANPSNRRKAKVTYPTTVEYLPNEKLDLLVNAIKAVVVDTALMEKELFKFFPSKEGQPKQIIFCEDESGAIAHTLLEEEGKSRIKNAKILKGLLDEIGK